MWRSWVKSVLSWHIKQFHGFSLFGTSCIICWFPFINIYIYKICWLPTNIYTFAIYVKQHSSLYILDAFWVSSTDFLLHLFKCCADELGGREYKGFSFSQWDYTRIKGGKNYYIKKFDILTVLYPNFSNQWKQQGG